MSRFLCLFGLCIFACAASDELPIDRAFDRLYSFQFEDSQKLARAYSDQNGNDALGHATLAVAYLFSEMNRLQVFNKELFKDDKGAHAQKIGADAKRSFDDALNRAKYAGLEALKKNDKDPRALLGLLIATGAERDFAALVEKRYKDSYYAAKASQEYALRLQAVDPDNGDAWFTRGFSEYLVASAPFVVRWLLKIDQVTGDKSKGLQLMEKCATNGHYLKPFAQMLLASIYQKDKRPVDSKRLLEAFAGEYPENAVIREELLRLGRAHGI